MDWLTLAVLAGVVILVIAGRLLWKRFYRPKPGIRRDDDNADAEREAHVAAEEIKRHRDIDRGMFGPGV
ncbi:hypothetical protein WJX64_01130 [Leifsonia sp. YIM 134122]|uniref:Uncharacterized protein n=1 Tax=Leifsonia stereocauli TaxID=3134136 RepID=A0ABU9VZH0_9MICO